MSFRAATYNVLATASLWGGGTRRCSRSCSASHCGMLAVGRHTEALNAALSCLQAVEEAVFASLEKRLGTLGSEGYDKRRSRSNPSGCATFCRRGLFTPRRVQRRDFRDG